MGCCGSTQAGDDGRRESAPAAVPQPTSPTSRTTTTSLPALAHRPLQVYVASHSQSPSRSTTPRQRPSSSIHTPRLNLASHERYNVPLTTSPAWTSTSKIWTPTQVHRERQEFFETRVTGRPEVWGALQNVCELVRGGDIATAQGILDAMGVTLPTGSLVDGCYDEVGNLYRLPEVVVSDPANMGRGSDGEELTVHRSRNSNNIDGETMIGVAEPKITASAEGKVLCGEEGGMETDDHGFLERRREEKGKESERDALKVRCRLSDRGGPDVVITLGKTQHVGSLAKKVQTEGNVSPSLRIRLAYLGRILSEADTLEAQGWKEGQVLNALVVGHVS